MKPDLEWSKRKRNLWTNPIYRVRAMKSATKAPSNDADVKRVPVTIEQNQSVSVIRLEGEIDIASAAELKKALLQALGTEAEMRLDVERATELDVTALQLLWAAQRAAQGSGRIIAVVGAIPAEIVGAAREAGLEKFPVGVEAESAQGG